MTILTLLKMAESVPNRKKKTRSEKENLFIMSHFSFSHSVLRLVPQARKNQGLFWKGLKSHTVRERIQARGGVILINGFGRSAHMFLQLDALEI